MQVSRISNTMQANSLSSARAAKPLSEVSFNGKASQKAKKIFKNASFLKRTKEFLGKALKAIKNAAKWVFNKLTGLFKKKKPNLSSKEKEIAHTKFVNNFYDKKPQRRPYPSSKSGATVSSKSVLFNKAKAKAFQG